MNPLYHLLCATLVLSLGQNTLPPVQPGDQSAAKPKTIWLERAQHTTDYLVDDAAKLDSSERAVLWARLGEIWWKTDQTRARTWLQKAVKLVDSAFQSESPNDYRRRMATTRILLGIVTPLDKSLGSELAVTLKAAAKHPSNEERDANATTLAKTAESVVKDDPRFAAELGSQLLRTGGYSHALGDLLFALRKQDPHLADALFDEALNVVRITYQPEMFHTLIGIAFPSDSFRSTNDPAPPPELKAKLINILTDGVVRVPASPEDKAASCRLSPLIVRLIDYVPAQQVGRVRTIIQECRPQLDASSQQQLNDSLRENGLDTVEKLLEAAHETSDVEKQAVYLLRASYLAEMNKDFERSISILDNMSISTRQKVLELWESKRWSIVTVAALAYINRKDWASLSHVIADTPAKLRPFAQLRIIDALVKAGDRTRAIEFATEARAGLAKSDGKDIEYWYIQLANLYTRLIPQDAVQVLSEGVAEFNRKQPGRQTAKEEETKAEVAALRDIPMSASLLDLDNVGVESAISLLVSPITRVGMRLGMLKVSLAQYASMQSATSGAAAKTTNN